MSQNSISDQDLEELNALALPETEIVRPRETPQQSDVEHHRLVREAGAECVMDTGFCEVCYSNNVPIYAGLDRSGEWIGMCVVCTAASLPNLGIMRRCSQHQLIQRAIKRKREKALRRSKAGVSARERKRLENPPPEREPKPARFHPLQFAVRDVRSGETSGWYDLRSGRDCTRRIGCLMRFYQ